MSEAGIRPTQLVPTESAVAAWQERSGQGPAALLDVGATAGELMVVENGHVTFSRRIAGGSAALTREMTGVLVSSWAACRVSGVDSPKAWVGVPITSRSTSW